jgi:hypothetical protein
MKLLIFGNGILGGQLLDLLATNSHPYSTIVVASKTLDRLQRRSNLSRFCGLDLGYDINFVCKQIDLENINAIVDLLIIEKPDVVFQSACIWSWWKIRELPPEYYHDFDRAGVGAWLPLYAALTYNVALAIKASGLDSILVNACYPDVTNPVLKTLGIAPLCGIGNVARSESVIRCAIADFLNCSANQIAINLYAQHYSGFQLLQHSEASSLPFLLRIYKEGIDITEDVPLKQIIDSINYKYPRVRGLGGQLLTAISAFNILKGIASDEISFVHVPGPKGEIGGYPCKITKGTVFPVFSKYVTKEMAENVNIAGMQLEGVQSIGIDGTIRFTESGMEPLKRHLGYQSIKIHASELLLYAKDLACRYREFAEKLPRHHVS